MCDSCKRREDADKQMWLMVRRALLSIASAIAKRYDEGTETRNVRKVA